MVERLKKPICHPLRREETNQNTHSENFTFKLNDIAVNYCENHLQHFWIMNLFPKSFFQNVCVNAFVEMMYVEFTTIFAVFRIFFDEFFKIFLAVTSATFWNRTARKLIHSTHENWFKNNND